ncbi:hypothetical protein [Roseibium aggregatum]|uniref:Uncharacterized protein n=1 Tax=Roseibium aggregatum TaxID=187304 RepID=A0A926S8A2_9HYPH|nr:hypothetical protein [Roseibium aggregatum]MBD1549636.1 hypothetical protein [Roseibium aggregatum]
MEERDTEPLGPFPFDGTGERPDDWLNRVQRALSALDLPCACQDKVDRTILALEEWETQKVRRRLVSDILEDFSRLKAGLAYLGELQQLGRQPVPAEVLKDHSESLKFLADTADRCARHLDALARVDGKEARS